MTRYHIGADSAVTVHAKSNVHDTEAVWSQLSGTVNADVATLGDSDATTAHLVVDMDAFDAGDFLRNRKLRKDLDVQAHPEARFELTRLADIAPVDDDSFAASAEGVLHWRHRDVPVTAVGRGRITDEAIDATAHFQLDIRQLGIRAPKLFMFKMDHVVEVTVTLRAQRQ